MSTPSTIWARLGIVLLWMAAITPARAQQAPTPQPHAVVTGDCGRVPSPAPTATEQSLRATVDACVAKPDLALATDWLVVMHRQAPSSVAIVDEIVQVLLQQDRGEEAVPWRRVASELLPESNERLRELAQAYLAIGQPVEAARVQERLALANPDVLAEWETLALWAGWASLPNVRIRAMAEQTRLAQTNFVDVATELGQTYSWTGQPEQALEQYERVYALTPNDKQLGLTIARLQAGLDRNDQAIETLLDVTEDGSDSPQAQFLLAQLTHWTPRWTIARRNYRLLLRNHPTHEARDYQDLLTAAHGPRLFARAIASADSNNVTRITVQSSFDTPVGARVRAGVRTEHVRMTERTEAQELASRGDTVQATLELRPGDPIWFTMAGGYETLKLGRRAALGDVNVHATLGTFYPKLTFKHQTWASGVQAVRARISYSAATAAFWVQAGLFEVGASAEYGWLSDGNTRTEGYGSVTFAPKLTSVIFRPNLVAGYTDFARQKVGARPYFTQDQALTIAAGLDVGFQVPNRFVVTVGYSPAIDVRTGTVLHGPRARVWTDIPKVGTIELIAERRGAPVYSTSVAQLTYTRRF